MFEGIYQASTYGRVRNVKTDRILKSRVCIDYNHRHNGRKDAHITLWKDKQKCHLLLSRVIAATFCGGNLYSKLTVNHIDGDTLNNKADNLEWITRGDNVRYGREHGQFRNAERPVTLVTESGKEIYFPNQKLASLFLHRSASYIHDKVVHKKLIALDTNGTKYYIKK